MGWTAVQRKGKGAAAVSSLSIGAGDGWATPTSGNLLVVTANSDATVSTPSGWALGPSVVDGNGAYIFYKISNGTESTVTVTPGSAANTTMTAAEYSGNTASPFDASNTSTIAGTSGNTTTAVSVTTTADGDLVIAAALIHATGAGSPANTPSWTNSFANVITANDGLTTITATASFVAELVAGTAGAYSTGASWTNNYNDRQELVIAFKAASTAAPAYPFGQVRRGRIAVPVRARRQTSTPVRAQVNPPYQLQPVHRTRQVLGRLRGRVALFAPPQVVVPPPAYPVPAVHRLRQALGRLRGRNFTPTPPQVVVTPPAYVPQAHPGRRGALLGRVRSRVFGPLPVQSSVPAQTHPSRRIPLRVRGRFAAPVPPQVIVAPPAYPPGPVHRLRAVLGRLRGRPAIPTPPQQAVPVSVPGTITAASRAGTLGPATASGLLNEATTAGSAVASTQAGSIANTTSGGHA